MSYSTLSKAPIIEAVIDFQFESNDSITIEDIENYYINIKDEYTIKKRKMSCKHGFNLDKNGVFNFKPVENKPIGFRF